jgi:hypothetical protein
MRWIKILAVQAVIAFVLPEAVLRVYNPIGARVRGSEIGGFVLLLRLPALHERGVCPGR